MTNAAPLQQPLNDTDTKYQETDKLLCDVEFVAGDVFQKGEAEEKHLKKNTEKSTQDKPLQLPYPTPHSYDIFSRITEQCENMANDIE